MFLELFNIRHEVKTGAEAHQFRGESIVADRTDCLDVFGANGGPARECHVPFSTAEIRAIAREQVSAMLFLRYAPLEQLVQRHKELVDVPSSFTTCETEGETAREPVYRLVLGCSQGKGEALATRVKKLGLGLRHASFTTGLSAALLALHLGVPFLPEFKTSTKHGSALIRQNGRKVIALRVDPLFSASTLLELVPRTAMKG